APRRTTRSCTCTSACTCIATRTSTSTSTSTIFIPAGEAPPHRDSPQPFVPFLNDADYEDLRWYLEDYMDLPDVEESLAALATWPAPLDTLVPFLRSLAAGEEPAVPGSLPREVVEGLGPVLTAVRAARSG